MDERLSFADVVESLLLPALDATTRGGDDGGEGSSGAGGGGGDGDGDRDGDVNATSATTSASTTNDGDDDSHIDSAIVDSLLASGSAAIAWSDDNFVAVARAAAGDDACGSPTQIAITHFFAPDDPGTVLSTPHRAPIVLLQFAPVSRLTCDVIDTLLRCSRSSSNSSTDAVRTRLAAAFD